MQNIKILTWNSSGTESWVPWTKTFLYNLVALLTIDYSQIYWPFSLKFHFWSKEHNNNYWTQTKLTSLTPVKMFVWRSPINSKCSICFSPTFSTRHHALWSKHFLLLLLWHHTELFPPTWTNFLVSFGDSSYSSNRTFIWIFFFSLTASIQDNKKACQFNLVNIFQNSWFPSCSSFWACPGMRISDSVMSSKTLFPSILPGVKGQSFGPIDVYRYCAWY